MNKKHEGFGRFRQADQQTQRQNPQKGDDNQNKYPDDNYSLGRKPDPEASDQRTPRNDRQDKGEKPQRKMFGFKQDQDQEIVKMFCGHYKGMKRGKLKSRLPQQTSKKQTNNKEISERRSRKSNGFSMRGRRFVPEKQEKIYNPSICWVQQDDFNDGINWSDDQGNKPEQPHQKFYSKLDATSNAPSMAPPPSIISKKLMPTVKQGNTSVYPSQQDQRGGIRRRRRRGRKSLKYKQSSLKMTSNDSDGESQDDDRNWFQEVKTEEMTMQRLQRANQQQRRERQEYQAYKKRLYRKKRMAETRKVFEKEELQQLREQFQQIYDQEANQEEDQLNMSRRGAPTIGLAKLTLKSLGDKYGSSPATINNLYRQWRFDPTLSKPLSRFERIFNLGWGNKPAKPVIAREKTLRRIQLISRLILENPFVTQQQMVDAIQQSQQPKQKIVRSGILRLLRMANYQKKKLRYMNYRPQLLISNSIVVMGLLSISGNLLFDARFSDYPEHELENVLKKFIEATHKERGPSNKVIAINPIKYRNPHQLKNVFEGYGWEVFFLPLHALELNPLYMYYTDMREFLKRKRLANFQHIFNEVVTYLRDNDEGFFGRNYISRLQMFLQKAEKGEPF